MSQHGLTGLFAVLTMVLCLNSGQVAAEAANSAVLSNAPSLVARADTAQYGGAVDASFERKTTHIASNNEAAAGKEKAGAVGLDLATFALLAFGVVGLLLARRRLRQSKS